ncbi:MAG: hypothetical protein A2Y07_08460 [Planctomycetes bacterium GWF2_50_10]|nr:MAG: hypothetical protein A2Y07_08460 [Planctomycetes bacterium GWF2_50_10]
MKQLILVLVILSIVALGIYVADTRYHFLGAQQHQQTGEKSVYYCPMHPQIIDDKPGECPICFMSLIKKIEEPQSPKASQKKILYYRNPMNPAVTSPVPMKDEMGMDYVPVYEEAPQKASQVYISPEKQQLIGVKKAPVKSKHLTGELVTVGRVAYDPNLFVAQQEYLQAVKSRGNLNKAAIEYAKDQVASFLETAKRKLMLMGMSEKEINALEKAGKPDQNLYLPNGEQQSVWVYVTVFEYEAGLVKEGQSVEVEAGAYPGQKFTGQIISISPILDPATRTLKVRSMVNNTDNLLKLEMFVNVRIKYDLGEKLAIPREAVMRAGTRDLVFVADSNGHFETRPVTLGLRAGNDYVVLDGLAAGETVVTSGNFLIDSESKLNAIIN